MRTRQTQRLQYARQTSVVFYGPGGELCAIADTEH